MPAAHKRDVKHRATGPLLGQSAEEVSSSTWLLGHDLKSPVAIIVSAMEVMITLYEDDERMAEVMPLVRGALAAANREHNMISDMLDLARFELGELQLNQSQHSLSNLIHEGLRLEQYNLTNKQLQMELDLPVDDPLETAVDAELFLRVISALVDNVLKFTIKDDRLLIRAGRRDGFIVVEFADTGRPIMEGYEAAILGRASQWTGRQAGSRTSVGMGLPFTRAAAAAHGGDFRCYSDAGTGLTYMILRLPIR
jgi:two-component system cell cycle sensor histidine kinase PleC